ncbi:MAG: radical SAM protein [Chloroflexi bacterium]|nr:radical SAM protein [Chloroflexota bacterium]
MKVYLADLVHGVPANYVVPLNIAYVAAYSKATFKDDLDVSLFKSPDELLTTIGREQPDVLGLSNYSWNYDLNHQIGKYIKDHFPSTVIIGGGPGIRTDKPGIKAFLERNRHLDAYAMFEGEEPFVNFLTTIFEQEKGHDWRKQGKEIKGCAYLDPDQQIAYAPCEPISNLERIPSPYLEGYLDSFLKQGFIPLLETNRGCPFKCTFCTWGISAHKKVRKFPLERVLDEIDYISTNYPGLPSWNFADANFGLFERDILIAKKLGEIRKANPSLRRVVVETGQTNAARSLKIFRHLGSLESLKIAVQSFTPAVLQNVSRTHNIGAQDVSELIREVKALGVNATTDILYGLPGETKQSHLETLREAFALGFDRIYVANIRLLPGSELETDESRQKHHIHTKYRLIQGAYGEYQGIRSLEAEESIRATSTMTEDDMIYLRSVHWLTWFGWNSGFLGPLLKYLRASGVNPLDMIIGIVEADKKRFPPVDALFDRFEKETKQEWFDSYEDLRSYYLDDQRFHLLLKGGFSKMNLKYTAELILDRHANSGFIDFIREVALEKLSRPVPPDIFEVMKESLIDVDEVDRSTRVQEKSLTVRGELLPFIVPESTLHRVYLEGEPVRIFFSKEDDHIKALKNLFVKFDFNQEKRLALENILEYFIDGFTYDISVDTQTKIEGEKRHAIR